MGVAHNWGITLYNPPHINYNVGEFMLWHTTPIIYKLLKTISWHTVQAGLTPLKTSELAPFGSAI